MLPFAITIFTGAFLLFQVQPLLGKFILPWFGGTPGVWTACLLFFQLVLLGGYAYAHLLSTRLTPRRQAQVHLVLLVIALAFLPITPSASWKPVDGQDPTLRILQLLAATIGLPYLVLSATGPLLQRWFSLCHPSASPWRLYALSNAGSLLALLSYPFLIEWTMSRQAQASAWGVGLCLFVACCGTCAWKLRSLPDRPQTPTLSAEDEASVTRAGDHVLWVTLPALASVLLIATTNKLCQDVAVIPFLWVAPLALYLVSFILCFDHPRWYSRTGFGLLFGAGVGLLVYLFAADYRAPLWQQVTGYTLTLVAGCMLCHGELYRLKPPTRLLTHYYLAISAGGALGGVLVGLVSPLAFTQYAEMPIALWVLTYVLGVVCLREKSRHLVLGLVAGALLSVPLVAIFKTPEADSITEWWPKAGTALLRLVESQWGELLAGLGLVIVCLFTPRLWIVAGWRDRFAGLVLLLSTGLGITLIVQLRQDQLKTVESTRNFYGTLKVMEYNRESIYSHYHLLLHGGTTHGIQFSNPAQARWPTTYYINSSGVGLALASLPTERPRRIGLVGLGTGTLAAYGRAGDSLRIYEINPEVERLARTRFTYLNDCPADVKIVMGDARLSLENELRRGEPQRFDVLALDAFSSDAIPIHLLTVEAFDLYAKHLAPDGIIAVHISNRHLDLRPVVEKIAARTGFVTTTIHDEPDETAWWEYRTTWVLVTRNFAFLTSEPVVQAAALEPIRETAIEAWTDDHASLLPILK